jgi:hypothetical protein
MEMTEKKTYETPEAEKMMFNYRDQVVAASGCIVSGSYSHETGTCTSDDATSNYTKE